MRKMKRLGLVLSLALCLSLCVQTISEAKRTVVFMKWCTLRDDPQDEETRYSYFRMAIPTSWLTNYGKLYKASVTTDADTYVIKQKENGKKKIYDEGYMAKTKKAKKVYGFRFYWDDESDEGTFDGNLKKNPFKFKFYFKDSEGDITTKSYTLTYKIYQDR